MVFRSWLIKPMPYPVQDYFELVKTVLGLTSVCNWFLNRTKAFLHAGGWVYTSSFSSVVKFHVVNQNIF